MLAVSTKNLTKTYKDIKAVDSLNLEIYDRELFALLGVNGAGKTTTIKMLSCLVKPDAGEAHIFGHDTVRESGAVKELIGLSPQETAIAPNLTVKENILLMCGAYGMGRDAAEAKCAELIERFSLREIISKRAAKLSGGWQRRLSLAMAIVSEPKLLFLDEPTLGLDVIARSELWDTIRELKSRSAIILTTHYMEEAEALADRVGIMRDGKLLYVGAPEEIKAYAGCDKFEDAFIKIVKGEC